LPNTTNTPFWFKTRKSWFFCFINEGKRCIIE
jgi:hypothetical protein